MLEGRGRWIGRALARLGLEPGRIPAGVRSLGITGHLAAGKSLFARDAAALLAAGGERVETVPLELFRRAEEADPGAPHDLETLVEDLLEPHARGRDVRLTLPPAPGAARRELAVPGDALLLLEGTGLLEPRLRTRLDRILFLELAEEDSLRRVAGRDARNGGPGALVRARRELLPAQRELDARCDPRRADLVLPGANPLGGLLPAAPGPARSPGQILEEA